MLKKVKNGVMRMMEKTTKEKNVELVMGAIGFVVVIVCMLIFAVFVCVNT